MRASPGSALTCSPSLSRVQALPRNTARILLFGIVLATLVCVASGRHPRQSIPAPLQTTSIRSGMESTDFDCRVERRTPGPDGGDPEERLPLFGLAAAGFLIPLPGFLSLAPLRAARSPRIVRLSSSRWLRARAPPVPLLLSKR